MVVTDLISRRNKILSMVVDFYVANAVPVGSMAVSKSLRQRISPATIRNIMVELEDLGYIMHPHTSAGRVPTDKGYRYYVDSLMEGRQLTMDERSFVEEVLTPDFDEIEDIVKRVARIISTLTGQTAVISFPRTKRRTFKRIELIPATRTKVYALLFTAQGIIKHSIFELKEVFEESELFKVARFLNEELYGLQLNEINEYLLRKIIEENDPFYYLFKEASEILKMSRVLEEEDERMFLYGTHYIMEQPEFKNAGKGKMILRALDEGEELLRIMEDDLNEAKAVMHIGDENLYEDIKECSIVIANYKIGGQNIGSLGVIGPKRMDYSRAVPVVEYVRDVLSGILTKLSE